MTKEVVLSSTQSVCPECLRKLDAFRLLCGSEVVLRKECPFRTPIWRGNPFFGFW